MADKRIILTVLKATDQDYFEALRTVSNSATGAELSLERLKVAYGANIHPVLETDFKTAAEDANLNAVLSAGGRVLQSITLHGAHHATVHISRSGEEFNGRQGNNPPNIYDTVTLSMKEAAPPETQAAFVPLVAITQQALNSFSVSGLGAALGEEARTHYSAREQALSRLETTQAKLLNDFEDLKKKHYDELDTKRVQQEKRFAELESELRHEHELRKIKLSKAELELETRTKALDDRSSTHVRRELRDKLKEILKDRQTTFSLSKDTRTRRRWVFSGYVFLLVFFLAVAITFICLEARSDTANYWYTGRQVAASLGFLLTGGFFLRWLNSWAARHADEEFKLKQLEIDIDRASWLVEMAFEWDEAKQSPIPDHLIETLSANLFGRQADNQELSMTAGDAIAMGLAGIPNASAEVELPGGKVKLDHKALKHVKKEAEKDK